MVENIIEDPTIPIVAQNIVNDSIPKLFDNGNCYTPAGREVIYNFINKIVNTNSDWRFTPYNYTKEVAYHSLFKVELSFFAFDPLEFRINCSKMIRKFFR